MEPVVSARAGDSVKTFGLCVLFFGGFWVCLFFYNCETLGIFNLSVTSAAINPHVLSTCNSIRGQQVTCSVNAEFVLQFRFYFLCRAWQHNHQM